jgi:hypothetical protein
MLIIASIEKEINATLAGFFEAVELEPSEALFKARSELKDAYNLFTVGSVMAAVSLVFTLISFF